MQKCCNEKCCNEKCCNKKCCNKKCCNEKCHKQPRRLSSFTSTDLLSKSDAPLHLTDTEVLVMHIYIDEGFVEFCVNNQSIIALSSSF